MMELAIPKAWGSLLYFLIVTSILAYMNSLTSNDNILLDKLLENNSYQKSQEILARIKSFKIYGPLIQLKK